MGSKEALPLGGECGCEHAAGELSRPGAER